MALWTSELTDATGIKIPTIGDPTYDSIQDWMNTTQSSGVLSGGSITDNGDGSVSVAAGTGLIKSNPADVLSETNFFDWEADSNVALVDSGQINWVYIENVSGVISIKSTTDFTIINWSTQFIIGVCYREGTDVSVQDLGSRRYNLANRLALKDYETFGYQRVDGLTLGETGVLKASMTLGHFYALYDKLELAAVDTNVSGDIRYWFRDGAGGWDTTTKTTYDNVKYDDGDGVLGDLGAGKYGVIWCFISLDGYLNFVYGRVNTPTLSIAQNEPLYSDLPDFIHTFSFLIGQVIVKQGQASTVEILSAFETVFQTTQATDHNSLANLNVGDYLHLTAAEKADNMISSAPVIAADLDGGGKYAVDLQNFPDMLGGGPGYWFDGVNDQISIGGDVELSFDTAMSILSFADLKDVAQNQTLLAKYNAGGDNREYRFYLTSAGNLQIAFGDPVDGAYGGAYTADGPIVIEKNSVYGFTFDDGAAVLYQNGKALSGSGTAPASLYTSTEGVNIGGPLGFIYGSVFHTLVFNLTLTESEVKAFSNGAPIPYRYRGASQVDLLSGWDFTSGWSVAGSGVATDADTFTTTSGAGSISKDQDVFIFGKKFRLEVDFTTTAPECRVQVSYTGTPQIIATEPGTYEFEVDIVALTDFKINIRNSDTGVSDFTTLKLTQIGCVLDLNGSGVGHDTWQDASGNGLHGAVSGALPVNVPADHSEKYIDLAVTGDTSFTLPAGYIIDSIILDSDGAIGGGIDVGTTNGGGEIVTAQVVSGAGKILCALVSGANYNLTGADDVIYITDADGTGWDSATVAITVKMSRMEL